MSDSAPSSPERQAQRRAIVAAVPLALLPLLGMLIFVTGMTGGVRGTDLGIMGLAILTGLIALTPASTDALLPPERRSLLISLLGITYTLAFCVPVYTEYFLRDGEMTGIAALAGIQPPDLIVAQFGALIGLIALFVGHYLPVGRLVSTALPTPRREWPPMWCFGIVAVMVPLGWAIFLGGQFGLIPARAGSGVLGSFASSFYFAIALLMLIWTRYRIRAALVMMALLIPPTMLISFFTGSKQLFLAPLMMIAFTYMMEKRQIKISWILAGVLLIITIYPLALVYRNLKVSAGFNVVRFLSDPAGSVQLLSQILATAEWGEYFKQGLEATGNRFNSLSVTAVIMRDTPDRVPYQHGWSIGNVFIAYIPRILWAGKPDLGLGQWITTNYGPGPHIRSATAPSWIGEFYLNFSYAGIVVGMICMGIFIRIIQEYLLAPRTIPIALAGVAALWTVSISLEKGLYAAVNGVTFKAFPIVLAHILFVMMSGSPRPRQEEDLPPDGRLGTTPPP